MRLDPLIGQTQDPEIQALLHPSAAFAHPRDVANDPDLTLHEKRAILSSWASDACAVESCPPLRRPPGGKSVTFDEVMDALRSLDDDPHPGPAARGYACDPASAGRVRASVETGCPRSKSDCDP